ALLLVEGWHTQLVADEFQTRIPRMTGNRKDRLESCLQSLRLATLRRCVRLEERGVRIDLRCQQVRDLQHARTFREALADALLFGEGIGHGHLYSGVPGLRVRRRHTTHRFAATPERILAGLTRRSDCGLVCGLFKWQKAGGFPPACCTV